jgi:hypothetical protein
MARLAGRHVHDLHATILNLLGLDHEKLTFFFQSRKLRIVRWTVISRKCFSMSSG